MEIAQPVLLGLLFVFTVFVIIFSLNCLKRLGGNLKSAVIFLILAMGVKIIREVLDFFSIWSSFYFDFIVRVLVILLIFLSIISISKMIKEVDGVEREERMNHYKKKKG